MFDTRFDTIQRKLAEANSLNQRKIVLLSDATTNDEEQKVYLSSVCFYYNIGNCTLIVRRDDPIQNVSSVGVFAISSSFTIHNLSSQSPLLSFCCPQTMLPMKLCSTLLIQFSMQWYKTADKFTVVDDFTRSSSREISLIIWIKVNNSNRSNKSLANHNRQSPSTMNWYHHKQNKYPQDCQSNLN